MTKRIIVIGASAGGLNALRRVFAELQPDLPAAVFAVLHTTPESRYLIHLLAEASAMPLEPAVNGPIREGTIYVAPPDNHLSIDPGVMHVYHGPKENRVRPSIDVLFRSAALAYGNAVIGVVLTGMLDDGTAGLFYVKRQGGTTIVQDPNDAEFKEMPQNALAHVSVDYTVPLKEVAPLLSSLVRKELPAVSPRSMAAPNPMRTSELMLQQDKQSSVPSDYTCPECYGPLDRIHDGSPPRFRCKVGHGFGLMSLTYAQAETAEQMLWSAMQSLKTKGELEDTMRIAAELVGDKAKSEMYGRRSRASKGAAEILEKILGEFADSGETKPPK